MIAIINKRLIGLIFLAIILLSGLSFFIFQAVKSRQAKNQESAQSGDEIKIASREKALDIAQRFLKKQDYAKDYSLDSAKVENFTDFWSVWFDKKDKSAKPNKGLIQVDKKTGEAKWKELQ